MMAETQATVEQPEGERWGWWAGRDAEYFNLGGPFATREEAIEAGREGVDAHEGFAIIEAQQRTVEFSAKWLIESQYTDNDDLFSGEHDEPGRRGAHHEADAELQAYLDDWAERHQATFVAPEMFLATRNEEHIPAEDASAARTDGSDVGGEA